MKSLETIQMETLSVVKAGGSFLVWRRTVRFRRSLSWKGACLVRDLLFFMHVLLSVNCLAVFVVPWCFNSAFIQLKAVLLCISFSAICIPSAFACHATVQITPKKRLRFIWNPEPSFENYLIAGKVLFISIGERRLHVCSSGH